uniref:Uncharacterized protein n=1 Tax=Romanomermis culicivorax TaxID=13658 RepID=A0A915JDS8_ROMCU
RFGTTSIRSNYEFITVDYPKPHVAHVQLNRPDKRNALNRKFWLEIGQCFARLAETSECRSIVLSGAGKCFCSGLDLNEAMGLAQIIGGSEQDTARKAYVLRETIKKFQNAFTMIEKICQLFFFLILPNHACPKPVIAAIHGLCIGGATGMITAADIRYTSIDTIFQIKEIDLGIAADVGQLQRLPKIMGNESLSRELCFTGRMFTGEEAFKVGLVSRIFQSSDDLKMASIELAEIIAGKSPVAMQGIKVNLNYARDHPVEDSLEYAMHKNASTHRKLLIK